LFNLVFFGYGLISFLQQNQQKQDSIFIKPYISASQNPPVSPSQISIDIEGAVVSHGVGLVTADKIINWKPYSTIKDKISTF